MRPVLEGPTLAVLKARLLDEVRRRLAQGDFTERGFARMIGVSQPHFHNVLKGRRILTQEVGDAVLGGLGISTLDLLPAEELGRALEERQAERLAFRQVPLLVGRLGPEARFPDWHDVAEWVKLPAAEVRRARRPAVVELEEDPQTAAVFPFASHALLDLDESARVVPTVGAWYALRWGGAGYIRQVRLEGNSLTLLGQRSMERARLPEQITVSRVSVLQVIRARVLWMGSDPRGRGVLDQRGEWVDAAC